VPSNEVSATPTAGQAGLGIPSGVAAEEGDGFILLSWNDVTGATAYDAQIARSAAMTTPTTLAEVDPPLRIDASVYAALANDTTYYLRVRATNGTTDGAFSSVIAATPTAVTASCAAGAPCNPSVTPGDRVLIVDWEPVAGAAGYRVYYDTYDPPLRFDYVDVTAPPALLADVTNGTAYHVIVVTYAGVAGPDSAQVSGAPAVGAHTFTEDFAGETAATLASAGWVTTDLSGGTNTVGWEAGTNASGGWADLDGDYLYADTFSTGERLWARIETPAITLDADPVLTFDYYFAAGTGDRVDVLVQDGAWSSIASCSPAQTSFRTRFACYLGANAGHTIRIGFEYQGDYDYFLHVDDVWVQ
jgi:hypothetical protein